MSRSLTAGDPRGALALFEERAPILVVDDSAEKLLAFETILEELGEEIVTARSGREALRAVLERDFAVVLLDVNMPGLDGFDTAMLIRQRPRSEHTPVIFVTAYADDAHTAKGYELGAVDFIITPAPPEVLRSKVSVFVDLFRQARQINRQAAELKRHAEQLARLAQASLAINASLSLERMLEVVAETARQLPDAAGAVAMIEVDQPGPRTCASVAEPKDGSGDGLLTRAAAATAALAGRTVVLRLTSEELMSDERWRAFRPADGAAGPFLALPFVGREGRGVGFLHVFGGQGTLFTEEDEALLLQLSQIATVAIENVLFFEAREANRLKDEFLTTLSHELRTPLTAILGWTRILRSPRIEPERMLHGLEVIERNVRAQTKLIEDLLDVSRIMTGKLALSVQPMLLAPTVETTVESLRPAADAKKLALKLSVSPEALEPSAVMGDPDRLQQVVWNLLSNAIKFTPQGGAVDVELDRQDGAYLLRVADNGSGMHPKFIPHIFERFRQADSSTTRREGGLGIGLAIVRRIVELHGGTVTADSQGLEKGSTFTVRLPVHPVDSPAALAVDDEAQALPDLKDVRILVVDDESDAREVLSEALSGSGATVTTAGSVEEAIRKLEAGMPDVLVSDIAMPNGDGYALIKHVREVLHAESVSLPAVALTAYAREEDRRRAYSAGFQRHLAKPVEPAALVSAISELARANRSAVEERLRRAGQPLRG
jgi:signal transduction histidine kinase